jgi:O-antigen/teichoic acid export membrane protein
VRTFLIVGLIATPLALLILLLSSSLAALERWRAVLAMNVIPFALPFAATVILFAVGDLTVATAATATIAGSLLAIVPALPMLASVRRPRFRLSLAREGIRFGAKSWLGGLAQTINGRLDQLLMITLVPPRQLGLYAVATTLSMAPGLVTGAVSPPLMTRIASGERFLAARAVRTTIMLTAAMNVVVAIAAPIILPLLFGSQFRDAVPMAWILLGASIPLAGANVLSTALQADGAPLVATIGEGIALIVTVGGLIVLLGPLQGIGAAIVSLAAYSASFAYQLWRAHQRLDTPLTAFVVPTRADVAWAARRVGETVQARRSALT